VPIGCFMLPSSFMFRDPMSPPSRQPRRRSKGGTSSLWLARQRIARSLWARQREIEEEVLTRIEAIPGSAKVADPEYIQGQRAAIAAAIGYGIGVIERDDAFPPAVPAVLLTQARLAVRNSVPFETVARRYASGYTLLVDLLLDEIESAGLYREAGLKGLARTQGALLDGLLAAVATEYEQERVRPVTQEMRRSALVRRLLAGESLDTSILRYEFDAFHIAAIASGAGATTAIKGLAKALDCVPLVVSNGDGATWAWLGRRSRHDLDQLTQLVASRWPSRTSLVIGEPGQGISGWRRTHQQAAAALVVAMAKPGTLIRYADYELLSAAAKDPLLAHSLRENYLEPFASERDGGAALRDTLRAYFAVERNGVSAAAALKVTRQTVKNRLDAVEARIGRPVTECSAEMETALRLEELEAGLLA
jgi:hypothetical protein